MRLRFQVTRNRVRSFKSKLEDAREITHGFSRRVNRHRAARIRKTPQIVEAHDVVGVGMSEDNGIDLANVRLGDEGFEQSKLIDFEPERLRTAAPALLKACKEVRDILSDRQTPDEQENHLLTVVDEAIAQAAPELSEGRPA